VNEYPTILGGEFLDENALARQGYSETEIRRLALDYRLLWEMFDGCSFPVIQHKKARAYRIAQDLGQEAMLRQIVRVRMFRRLAYSCITQRHWQGQTRRPSRAKHHDSISIRDRYVTGRKTGGN
jgi:hypothetical protein